MTGSINRVVPQKCLDNVVGGTYFDGQAAFGIVGGSFPF